MKRAAIIIATVFALPGCFIVSKPRGSSNSQSSTVSEPKNHGQERSQEVHERNAERKAEKDNGKK